MLEMLTKFSGLVSNGSSAELDCIFPINRETEAVVVHQIRGLITSPNVSTGSNWWYFGFTKDPKSYPPTSIDWWFDEATFARLQEADVIYVDGINYAWNGRAIIQEAKLDIVLPYKILGVFWNEGVSPRRFVLEIYYEVIEVGRKEAQILWRKFNKRV